MGIPLSRMRASQAAIGALTVDTRELAGAFADLGVLVPIAVALIVRNGLSPTAVLLPAGLLYLAGAWRYRLPVPVQPLKAFGAIAIAKGLGSDAIAAGALLMGVTFVMLGASGLLDRVASLFGRPLIRGVQLTVGLLLLSIAWGLVTAPPAAFTEHRAPHLLLLALGVAVVTLLLAARRLPVTLVLLVAALAAIAGSGAHDVALGPSAIHLPSLNASTLWTAFVVLVVPQVPLSFANSCLATADAARRYFGERAARVRPGRLAVSLGIANLLAGGISGMPVCHGAGGLTAHRSFGARTGGAPLIIGTTLLLVGLMLGAGLTALLAAFPLPILAGLLAASGLLHIGLLRDLRGRWEWILALAVGILGFTLDLAVALAIGLVASWMPVLLRRLSRS